MNSIKERPLQQTRTDEISVRKLMLTLIDYSKMILGNWYWAILGSLLLGGYSFHSASQIIDTYPARVKLFVSPQQVSKNNAILVEIFSKLVNTQQMLIKVFLRPVIVDDTPSILINEYLSTYFELNPSGLPDDIPVDFKFEHTDLKEMNRTERHVLNQVIAKVSTPISDYSDGFVSLSGDFNMGFITINISSPSEELSLLLLDEFYKTTEELLLGNAVFANKQAYENLATETDSLSSVYKKAYISLNKYQDRRGRLLKKIGKDTLNDKKSNAEIKYLEKKIHRLSADVEISKTGYLAVLEQQKSAQLDLDQSAIIIQELEHSLAPLAPYRPQAKVAAIKGGMLGGIAVVVLLILIAVFREIKKELYQPDPSI